jgi:hypothetical protein
LAWACDEADDNPVVRDAGVSMDTTIPRADAAPDVAPDIIPDTVPDLPQQPDVETSEAGGGDLQCSSIDTGEEADAMDGADAGWGSGCNIPCLAELTRDCLPAGSCNYYTPPLHNTAYCYANGVVVNSKFGSTVRVTVQRPDHTICYEVEGYGLDDGRDLLVWKGHARQVLAQGYFDRACGAFSVTCGGKTYVTRNPGACPALMGLAENAPIPGPCTFNLCSLVPVDRP